MEDETAELAVVPVRIVNAGEIMPEREAGLKATCYTVVLSATDPIAELLPQDPRRCYADVQAIDDDTVVCHSIAQAKAPGNNTASLPNPQGFLLAKANTGPTRIYGQQQMWATNQAQAGRVAVISYQRM